jgi:predicted dehydrogenase
MTERVKWGVLGNATIARVCVIPALRRSKNGTVHALATRSPHQAKAVVSENHIEKVYDSYEALLADPEIDAVYVPLPNHLHHPWTIKALETGKHVLCEKPLACSAREALEMSEMASRAGLWLMEAFMYRFHPRSRRIQEMVAGGEIGEPCWVRSSFCFHIGEERLSARDNPRMRPEMGGGALLDVGCYGVSVARWLLGAEPTHLQAQAVYHPSGVDVQFVGTMRFADRKLAIVEASFVSALQQTFAVVGTEAAIELPHNAFIPWEKDALLTMRGREQEVGQEQIIPGADEYQLMVEHFSEAVLRRRAPMFTPEESVRNMRVLDGLAEAARTGRTIEM